MNPQLQTMLTYVLRDAYGEDAPVRSEGLELIEQTDPARFLECDWEQLLFVCDFFFGILVRAEAESDFVSGWQDHAGVAGNGESLLFRRIAEVCRAWLDRLEFIARHHRESGSEPDRPTGNLAEYFQSGTALTFLTDEGVEMEAKFEFLSALTRMAVGHAGISTVLAELAEPGPEAAPDTVEDTTAWLSLISENLMAAGYHAAPSLIALSQDILVRIEAACDDVCSRYEDQLVEEFRSNASAGDSDRRVVVIDPGLACDLCVIRTLHDLARALRSNDEANWKGLNKWITEGQRILNEPARNPASLGSLDLSGATSWFQPNFGTRWPSCIADVEEAARAFLIMVTARRDWSDVASLTGTAGGLTDIGTRAEVVRLRIPRNSAQPWHMESSRFIMKAAFAKRPLLTWLLFPSSGASKGLRFWRDGAHGGVFSLLEDIESDHGRWTKETLRRIYEVARDQPSQPLPLDFATALLPNLPVAGVRSGAEMMAPLIALWTRWGGLSEPAPNSDSDGK